MQLKREGWPEEDELVMCTVTGVNPHSVFCTMDEFGGRTGMIHISEIASGRIRNIREHVSEGKKIVCKVLRINKERGHIDLSLRRVNDMQKRIKLNQIKQEQLSSKIIENVAKDEKLDAKKLYADIAVPLTKEYGSVFSAFELVVKDELDLSTIVDKKIAEPLTLAVKSRIKPPQVTIGGSMKLISFASDGVQEIKDTLANATKEGIEVRYLGAGAYNFQITAEDYKTAEKALKAALEGVSRHADKIGITHEWKRADNS